MDQLTGGRLTLGLAPGSRQADYDLTGRDYSARGEHFDALLGDLHTAWDGQALTDDTR